MRIFAAALGFFAGVSVHAAALDSSWNFRVLRSPHFEAIYREDQCELAKRYLIAGERAHDLLFPLFGEAPYKTILVLKDDTDGSNGLANFLPYPHITVYPVLPSTLDSVDDYGDWPLEMMLHEYTHILNMYPAHSFYVPLKWIFGTVVRPNALLPKWYLEGLAVNLESTLSDHGRLRATETQASARALILDDRLLTEDVATINEGGLTRWPYGGRPYLFGGWWWQNLQREKGLGPIQTWNQNFSRRLPYFLNGPVREQAGKSVNELVAATTAHLDQHGRAQIESIKSRGLHHGVPLAAEDGEQNVFALSPSGMSLLYWQSHPLAGNALHVKTRTQVGQSFAALKGQRLFKTVGTLRARWLNEDSIIFDAFDLSDPHVTYRDIYSYDLREGRTTRITEGLRAQEPASSPSGHLLAFIQNDGGRNRLAAKNMSTGAVRTLVQGNYGQRISGPEFMNDRELLFSVRQKNGTERLHVYDIGSKQTRVWNSQLPSAQNARVTAEGVLVTDAATRARNVYLVKPGQPTRAISNTLTDIQMADYDPQRREVLVTELTASGRSLRAYPIANFNPPALDAVSLPAPPRTETAKFKLHDESYLPIAYLWPRYWIPFVYQVEDGFIFQGLTSNQDPVGRNRYSLLASYDTVTQEPSYGFSFVNSSLPTDIGVSYAKSVAYLGASGLTLESQSGSISFGNYWPFNLRSIHWNIGAQWDETQSTSTTYRRAGPEFSWQFARLQHPLNERWGAHVEFAHQEYLEQDGFMEYGRSYGHFALQRNFSRGRRAILQTRGALAPNLPHGSATVALGDRNVGGNYLVNLANSQFLLRGYPSGTFVGRKLVSANLELVTPAFNLDRGFGTFPLFLRNMELAVFGDALAVDGYGFNSEVDRYQPSRLSEFYTGAGTELRLNTTTGYHLPLAVTLGLFYGFNERFGGGFTPFFGIGFGGLSALEDKTP